MNETCGYCHEPVNRIGIHDWLGKARYIWIEGQQWRCVHAVWNPKTGVDDGVCMECVTADRITCIRCFHPVAEHRVTNSRTSAGKPESIGTILDQDWKPNDGEH
jgi:hypothetical protein